jgi:hypothetical protein
MDPMARWLIAGGLVLVVAGLLVQFWPSDPTLGHLPGDIRIERPHLRIYIPITSMLLLSLLLTAAFWVVSKLR